MKSPTSSPQTPGSSGPAFAVRTLDGCRPVLALAVLLLTCTPTPPAPIFPATPEVFLDDFRASEGIAFNGQGEMFVAADMGVWRVESDGTVHRLAEVDRHLGLAGLGKRDVLAADWGPSNGFEAPGNRDGVVWRVSPAGERKAFATDIGDPNAILGLPDGRFLVSDDLTDEIFVVDRSGTVELFTRTVEYPNGLALSPDGSTLYVAQTFTSLDPMAFDNRLWALSLLDGRTVGEPRLVSRVGQGPIDGLAVDADGRIYVADHGGGKVWRVEPASGAVELVAQGVPYVASLAFGEGEFGNGNLFATTLARGGGTVWRIPVGVDGVHQHR